MCYTCNCHKSGFRRNDSLKLTADAQKKHKEKQLQKQRTKYAKNKGNKGVEKNGKKGGKAFQVSAAEVDSDNDGEDENSDSNEEENSETSESEQEETKKRKCKKAKDKSEKVSKSVARAQAVDIFNAMDTKQRKRLLKYFGLSTAEMCMQSTNASRNHADSDLYFNTLCHQDQDISLQTAELPESSSEDELPEVEPSVEEKTVQYPQPVVARLLAEMDEELLAKY